MHAAMVYKQYLCIILEIESILVDSQKRVHGARDVILRRGDWGFYVVVF